ncbi:MAG: septation protein SpoVG family protein, partial [Planctomycetota bacterium]
FVAMPSRKLTAHCQSCGMKNHLRARFCNQCGSRLDETRVIKDSDGRAKLYADIAHPINSRCREQIQSRVVAEYHDELERAKSPDYVSRYDDYDAGDYHEADHEPGPTRRIDAGAKSGGPNRPHHPPQGDAKSPSGAPSPHATPNEANSGLRASREGSAGDRPRGEEGDANHGGFGAGIF